MTAQAPIEASRSQRVKTEGKVAIGLLLAVLLYRAVVFAEASWNAVGYPWQLDYGEGIVWQQMRWIFTPRAYGPIDGFPAIVFHYPPLYHALTSICANMLGTDELATGRTISIVSTITAAVASAILVDLLLEGRASRGDRRLCSGIVALLVFTYLPVIFWATFMRVDMLALALELFGLVAAFKSLQRPRLIYLASLLFVAAVYTKQTALAAPAATLAVLLLARPRLALRGIAFCVILGMTILVALGWLTNGGFYRHIFLYNINRLDASRLWHITYVAIGQSIYVGIAGFVVARRLADVRKRYELNANTRASLEAGSADVRLLIATAYLLVSTLMLVLIAKMGSNINYFLDWSFALGLFAAMAPSEVRSFPRNNRELQRVLGVGIPAVLAIGALFAPLPRNDERADSPEASEMAKLARVIAAAHKPVISDDMVVVIRGGQDVRWESAIFRELGSVGRWDERPFIARIQNHQFAFFVTLGGQGEHSFAQRYSPGISEAMDAAYPVREEMARMIIHRPRERALEPPPVGRL